MSGRVPVDVRVERDDARAVVAIKATIGDGPDRVVVGWLRDDPRWWCEEHGHRRCEHLDALARVVERTVRQ